MRIADYLDTLAWSQADLAREADISTSTVRRLLKSQAISRRSAQAVTAALARGLKRPITPADVTELHVTDLHRSKKQPATT
jgi:hypothetical protein